jgi:hypothetical protein
MIGKFRVTKRRSLHQKPMYPKQLFRSGSGNRYFLETRVHLIHRCESPEPMIIFINDLDAVFPLKGIQNRIRVNTEVALKMGAVSFGFGKKNAKWPNQFCNCAAIFKLNAVALKPLINSAKGYLVQVYIQPTLFSFLS